VKRVLLVCAEDCAELEKNIGSSGCAVVRTDNSSSAISRARHQQFDTAILVSTGREMDVTETALNLSDINPSLEIIILADATRNLETAPGSEATVSAIAGAKILTAPELADYLASLPLKYDRP
jgi:hypothetical protein